MKNQGCIYPFFAIFAIAGLGSGMLGFSMQLDRNHMISAGIKTTGTVVDHAHSKKSVASVVQYKDRNGTTWTYRSHFYTNINPDKIGDVVTVYYDPNNPEDVVLEHEGLSSLLPFIFLFTHGGIGFGGLYWLEKKRRRYQWLQQSGMEVLAQFTGVKETNNKGRYYTVQAEWIDPLSNTKHFFESEALSQNPADFMAIGSSIGVLIDPNKPERYWMDTAFAEG